MGFTEAQKFAAKWEGGLSNHPSDPGGLTNYGISLRFLRALGHDVDGDGDVDAVDIQALTPAGAAELLKQEFWTCQDLDSSPRLTAIAHYDASVNCGRSRAVRLLQSACNAFPGQQIKEDGKLGPRTRTRVASLDDATLATKCIQARQDFYKRLVVSDPKFSAFIDGWMNRTADLTKYILEVADHVQTPAVPAPAPIQSPASVLPADRLPDQPGDGTTMGDAVRAVGVPVAGAVTVGGVVLSKKLCVAIVAFAAVILNEPLHIGMDYGTCKEIVALACSYILGQAGVDIFKPIAAKVLGGQ